jgi:UDP-N-acetylmuramoyl-tripeptide--D-alanyl-D-alanine ligase
MELTLGDVVAATGGRLVSGSDGTTVRGFAFDTRALEVGQCFVAIREHRDGHDFVEDAFLRGASAALVQRVPPGARGPMVVVDEPLSALARLAAVARRRLEHATVVAVTGSVGKTSTKDLTAAAVSRRFEVHANEASFNNEIGLPVTLLGAPESTDVVVLEMGARFAGNIRDLCSVARPQVGVITQIGLAHAEHLGGRAGIAQVKGELLDALPGGGLAVLNADCDATPGLAARSTAPVLTVGVAASADVRIEAVEVDEHLHPTFTIGTPWGRMERVALAVHGEHQVQNAAMAATVALHLGVPLDDVALGLGSATPAAWRMQLEHTADGLTVLNDAYNASPGAVEAALRSFARLPVDGSRVAVLGEMRELGEHSASEHARIGALAATLGVDRVLVVGDAARPLADAAREAGATVETVQEPGDALAALRALVGPGDAVLVKASRAVGLEAVAEALVGERVAP